VWWYSKRANANSWFIEKLEGRYFRSFSITSELGQYKASIPEYTSFSKGEKVRLDKIKMFT